MKLILMINSKIYCDKNNICDVWLRHSDYSYYYSMP